MAIYVVVKATEHCQGQVVIAFKSEASALNYIEKNSKELYKEQWFDIKCVKLKD